MFLTARYIKTPTGKNSTSIKGFGLNPDNYVYEEVVGFVRNLQYTDLRQANVILDLKKSEIIKCRATKNNPVTPGGQKEQSFDEIFQYFYSNYSQYFDRMLPEATTKKQHNDTLVAKFD
jgi:hypothetical protein